MATKYNLQNFDGDVLTTKSKKQAAIDAAHKDGLLAFRVVTDSGTVVHEEDNRPVEEDLIDDADSPKPTAKEDTGETLSAKQARTIRFASSDAHRDFPGNYSIVMAPLAQDIAEAFGGIETEVETFSGKLVRRVHFYGSKRAVTAFLKVLDPIVEGAQPHLHEWQKANLKKRRGLTDMQKYLQHREVLAKYGKAKAREVKAGEHG